MASRLAALGFAIALVIGFSGAAGGAGPQPRIPDVATQACCAITAIDPTGGVVTARDTRTGRTFQFRVSDRTLLGNLRIGQPVYADFTANQVALTPGRPCCSIVSAVATQPQPLPGPAARPQSPPGSVPSLETKSPLPTGPSVFDPKRHGFEFINYFTGDILVDLPIIGRVNLGNSTYGLCGGMAYSTLDTFNLGAIAPDVPATPPASGTPMRSYLYERQVDSLKYDDWFVVRRLVSWIPKPLDDRTVYNPVTGGHNVIERGLIHLSGKEFNDKIRPELNAGRPVTIVLIKADGNDYLSNPRAAFSKNHQVLAVAAYRHGDEWDIDVYDPNFPNTVQTLHTGGRYQTAKGTTARTGAYRGFFRAPYRLERPPWVPENPAVVTRVRSFPAVSLGRPDSDD